MSNLSNKLGVSPIGFKAGGPIRINRAVKLDATKNQVVEASAIGDVVIGFAEQAAEAGDTVPVQPFGVVKAVAGAAVAVHAQVMPQAAGGGKVVTAAGAAARSCGITLAAAANADEVIPVLVAGPNLNGPANV